jgi:hypothetical protein
MDSMMQEQNNDNAWDNMRGPSPQNYDGLGQGGWDEGFDEQSMLLVDGPGCCGIDGGHGDEGGDVAAEGGRRQGGRGRVHRGDNVGAVTPMAAPERSGAFEVEGRSQPPYTTVMLRNMPNKYTRDMLVEQLNRQFRGEVDFVYLPIDFRNRCNVGYCFINFRTVECRQKFVELFDSVDVRTCLPGLNSRKVCEVMPARVQGQEENVRRLRESPVMIELTGKPDWMPLIFDEEGNEMPFPMPEGPLPAIKARRRGPASPSEGGGGGVRA